MPWDSSSIKSHNSKLHGKSAEKAAAVANAVLAKTGDDAMALKVANSQALKDRMKKPHRNLYKKD